MLIMTLLAILLAVSGNSAVIPPATECRSTTGIEKVATTRVVTARQWEAFRRVAAMRRDRGAEVLPGMIGCVSIGQAARRLEADRQTRRILRSAGLSARAYVETGWALAVADDPEAFGIAATPAVRANAGFIRRHRDAVNAIMHFK